MIERFPGDPREFDGDPFRRPYRIVLFFAIFALCCFLRLWNLGQKTFMHDETLFVTYTYSNLYKSFDYYYAPILHGPLMLLWQNVVFHVFGASDYTARLGCALLGVFSFFFIWKLRYWLGEVGTWFALTFYALSPGIAFFQRFFHNDALFLFNTLWIIASLANWWRTRDGRWGASALIAITALFTNKASAVFVYFSIVTFFLVYVIHDIVGWFLEGKVARLRDHLVPVPRFPGVVLVAALTGGFVVLVLTQVFEGIGYESSVTSTLGHDWALRDVRSIPLALGWMQLSPQSAPDAGPLGSGALWGRIYLLLFAGAVAMAWIVKVAVERRIGRTEFLTNLWRLLHETRWYMAGGLCFCLFFYLAVYTTFFKYRIGPFDIYKMTWAYWGGQHEIGRISGPFHQHIVNIALYETPSLIIVLAAWVFGLFRARWTSLSGIAFLLIAVAAAGFHVMLFKGLEWIPPDGGGPAPLKITYLKTVLGFALVSGVLTVFVPRAGKFLFPAGLVALLAFSICYTSTDAWAAAFNAPMFKDGLPVRIMQRHVNLGEMMEIKFNFDGGWTLALVMTLIFFATVHTWRALEEGARFHAFLIWWMVTSVGAACYAREAVPQVGIHAMMPTILLAASCLNRSVRAGLSVPARNALVVALSLSLLWSTKNTFNLNLRLADDPRERMAYGPSNRDVKADFDLIRRHVGIASLATGESGRYRFLEDYNDVAHSKDVRIFMKPIDQVSWPAKWYLRDVAYTEGPDPAKAVEEGWEFIFMAVEDEARFPQLKDNYHVVRHRGTTFWTPNAISTKSLLSVWKTVIPGHYLADSTDAEATQSREDWQRLWRYALLRETFEGTDRPYPAISSFDYIFCYRKDLF